MHSSNVMVISRCTSRHQKGNEDEEQPVFHQKGMTTVDFYFVDTTGFHCSVKEWHVGHRN